jgi:hypothetical protein
MTYDDADNLFDDKNSESTKPSKEETVLSAEEQRALQNAQMEIDLCKREAEEQTQRIEEMKRAEADAAERAARRQAEDRARQEAEAAARRKEEDERAAERAAAANSAQSVQEQFKEQAQKARERRAREEEEATNERKARADAKLQELEEKKAERVRELEALQEAARAARRKEEEDRRAAMAETQRKFQPNKNVWSAPERQGPTDDTQDVRGGEYGAPRDYGEDHIQPSSILKRETSRRTLWAPAADAVDKKSAPRGEPRSGRESRDRMDEQRQKEFYNKKFEKLSSQDDWREKKRDAQAKEKADQKVKREQRDKDRNSKKPDAKSESKPKGEESWRKKPDDKKKRKMLRQSRA